MADELELITRCVDDLMQKVKDTELFGATEGKEKVFYVYSEDDLFDKTKMVKMPAVGVIYNGLIPNSGDPSRQGLSADVNCTLVLIIDGKSAGLDMKNEAVRLLGLLRKAIRTKNSPSGHKWRFGGEQPAGNVSNLLVFMQRWSTMAPVV